ncbi:hypothetical protein [Thermomonospora amylolytica]|uniref:hypothetical protein n=1 Tax=Thermomonospora amylolytica TaxID=1411117 RepID=UPI000E6CD350|nr:hypothetical protein [Thermomonospora amylolytica]
MAKLNAFPEALGRLADEMGLSGLGEREARRRLSRVVDWLNNKAEWVAVVHADGNGMGRVFQEFSEIVEELNRANAKDHATAEEYVRRLRAFSRAWTTARPRRCGGWSPPSRSRTTRGDGRSG